MSKIQSKTLSSLRLELASYQDTHSYLLASYQVGQQPTAGDTAVLDLLGNKIQATHIAIDCIVGNYIEEVIKQYTDGLLTAEEFVSSLQWSNLNVATQPKC